MRSNFDLSPFPEKVDQYLNTILRNSHPIDYCKSCMRTKVDEKFSKISKKFEKRENHIKTSISETNIILKNYRSCSKDSESVLIIEIG